MQQLNKRETLDPSLYHDRSAPIFSKLSHLLPHTDHTVFERGAKIFLVPTTYLFCCSGTLCKDLFRILMANLHDEQSRKRKAITVMGFIISIKSMARARLLDIPREPYSLNKPGRELYIDSILLDDVKCRDNLRMGISAFNRLCTLMKEKGLLADTKNCLAEEQLMRCLHLLGHNVRHRVLEGRFFRSRETISRQFGECLTGILRLYKCLVADHADKIYSSTQLQITSDSRFSHYFKARIGNKRDNGWKDSVWKTLLDAIFEKTQVHVEKKHAES
ncbi:hypothetical protein BVC80_1591g31 [Macleaya cordata]|uniref:DUF8040 domain-containing protein n=1 Tax=Macleaya cordata TaxID=56857 RepID=A0A200QI37_MACCD|nr:hypothetical protein BVC80_1591g31 [Macleaya cordata]